jgi:hypothetical protein
LEHELLEIQEDDNYFRIEGDCMKTRMLVVLALLIGSAFLVAAPFTTTAQATGYTDITFQLPEYSLTDTGQKGMRQVVTDAQAVTMEAGKPELPIFSSLIELPDQGSVTVELLRSDETTISSTVIAPSRGMGDGPLADAMDRSFYASGSLYPAETIRVGTPAIMRDLRVAPLTIQPFAYNPVTHSLTVRREVTVRIHYTDTPGENEFTGRHCRSAFSNIARSLVVNPTVIRDEAGPVPLIGLLIIYPNNTALAPYVNDLAAWKRSKGMDVHIASTTQTGTTTTAIKNYIANAYTNWDNPPSYVMLIGDTNGDYAIPTWNDPLSGGIGDHPYGCLVGNDLLPELSVGRLSISTLTDMQVIVSKINLCERQVYTGDTNMYRHAVLAGDVTTSSGWSCELNMKNIKEGMLAWDPGFTFTEAYSGVATPITAGINQGASFYSYRGYLGMSGWGPSGLNNVNKLTNAVIITCGTGNFSSDCTTETMLRMGTPGAPTGAVTAIGMSTSSTHTQYNNIINSGIFYGLYREGMHTMGDALVRGKLALYMAYHGIDDNAVQEFSYWCSLLGDPSMEVFHTIPGSFNAEYDAQIPVGQNSLEVTVTDDEGMPVEGARVTARNDNETIFASEITDENGVATLYFNTTAAGSVSLVVAKTDYRPHLGTFTVSSAGQVAVSNCTVDDGDGNGEVNPGESVNLTPSLHNYTADALSSLTIAMTSPDSYVTITNGETTCASLAAGATGACASVLSFSVSPDVPDRHVLHFDLSISDNAGHSFQSRYLLTVIGADLDVLSLTVNDSGNNALEGGETAGLVLRLKNNGTRSITSVSAELVSLNSLIDVVDSTAYFGSFNAGQEVSCTGDGFSVEARTQIVPGMQIPMQLVLTNTDGYQEVETFTIPIGIVSVTAPLGPDAYGYMCYDQGDVGYADSPEYEWIEIDQNEGGFGTFVNIPDGGAEQGGTATVDLPFTFRYYGQEYNQVTICSNGFITFFPTEQPDFRNWPIPGPKCICPMIAAMWDDISPGTGGVFVYDDTANHRFIIEWSQCQNDAGGGEETFEIILYDPVHYQTSTFDAPFAIQYKVFNDTDTANNISGNQGNRCTIGMADESGMIGLQYAYDGIYPTAARPVTNESILYFTGQPRLLEQPFLILGDVLLFDNAESNVVLPGETVNLGIILNNLGVMDATDVFATLSTVDPYVTILADTASYTPIIGSGTGINTTFFRLTVADNVPAGHSISLSLHVLYNQTSTDLPVTLHVGRVAVLMGEILVNDGQGNNNGIMDPGETVQLIVPVLNTGAMSAAGLTVTCNTMSSAITLDQEELDYGSITPGANLQKVFQIHCLATAETGTVAECTIELTGTGIAPISQGVSIGVGFAGLDEDFEDDNGGFTGTGEWGWGNPSTGAHSGSSAWDVALNGQYGNGCNSLLTSEEYTIGSNSQLNFWHVYATESSWDGGNVKISTNGGTTWSILTPDGGYPMASISTGNACIPGEPGYSGTSNWAQAIFDLSDYAGQTVCFRWSFGSDGSVTGNGWTIDDVFLSGVTGNSSSVSGIVSLDNTFSPLGDVRVTIGDQTCAPGEDGHYTLYTVPGSFDLQAELPHYYGGTTSPITLESGTNLTGYDFNLQYLRPATELSGSLEDSLLTLTWDYNQNRAGQRSHSVGRDDQSRMTFQSFHIYRQEYCGFFTLIDSTQATSYSLHLQDGVTSRFYVTALYDVGESDSTNHVSSEYSFVDSDPNAQVPLVTRLLPNYPNPFNPETVLQFSLAQSGKVELSIFNTRGQKVATLVKSQLNSGVHKVTWHGTDDNGRRLASGVYLYRLETPEQTYVRKALLLK